MISFAWWSNIETDNNIFKENYPVHCAIIALHFSFVMEGFFERLFFFLGGGEISVNIDHKPLHNTIQQCVGRTHYQKWI
jgi:hypothetical protein